MKREYLLITLFFLIAAVVFYLFYRIIVPFFVPIAWASVLVIVFFPLYERLCKKIKSKRLASIILCFLIIVLIIGPLGYLFSALVQEAADAVTKVNTMYQEGELDDILAFDIPIVNSVKEKLSAYYDISQIDTKEIIKDSIDNISSAILSQTSWLIANGTKAVFYFFLMIFSMYYFFKDGEELINKIKRLMPLTQDQIDRSFEQLREVIQATMYGGIAIALLQGVLGGLLFFAVGIPSAIFWGAIMAFLAIIPFVGAFIIYVPAGMILILGGSYISGIVVIAIGTLVISQTDNVVRPYLISGRTQIHPLILFFAILGGIYIFGLLGIVIGPMIAAFFITLLRIFEFKLHPEDEELPVAPETSEK